jgi:hypothetical protein
MFANSEWVRLHGTPSSSAKCFNSFNPAKAQASCPAFNVISTSGARTVMIIHFALVQKFLAAYFTSPFHPESPDSSR